MWYTAQLEITNLCKPNHTPGAGSRQELFAGANQEDFIYVKKGFG